MHLFVKNMHSFVKNMHFFVSNDSLFVYFTKENNRIAKLINLKSIIAMNLTSSENEEFIREITKIIEENLGDENFGVRQLVYLSGMSQSRLYHRLISINKKSINQFIREIRLQKAFEMLLYSESSASEVAYKVGFGSPAYFYRCFNEFFGYPPGNVKKLKMGGELKDAVTVVNFQQENKKFYRRVPAFKKLLILFLPLLTVLIAFTVFKNIHHHDKPGDLITLDKRISLAVMPFRNLTSDTILDVWQLGIQINLVTSLSNVEELRVCQIENINGLLNGKGITNYASITPSIANSISRKLAANFVLIGSINKAGSTIRLNAQLTNSKTNEHFKSFQIDGNPANILHIADSLSRAIMNSLIISELKKKESAIFPNQFVSSTNSSEAYRFFIYGQTAYYKNDFTTASDWYLKALSIDSNLIGALAKISTVYFNLNKYTKAKEWCLRYYNKMDMMTIQQQLWAEVLYSYNFKTLNESVIYLKQLIELDDLQPITHFQLGDAYFGMFQYDKAIIEFEKALKIFQKWNMKPFWVSFYCELGISYHNTGQYKKEKMLYKKADKDFPDDPGLMDQHAWLSLVLGDTVTANRYIKKFISVREEGLWSEAQIAGNLAYIYSMAGTPEKEEEWCRRALSYEPENPGRLNTLAYILIDRDRNINNGMELVEKALKSHPDNFLFLHSKGWGLYKLGKYQEALSILQKSWDLRMEKSIYDHEAFLHLESTKKAVAGLK
jgi:tetratricopeptide (TPR) repeat protein/AraC-like DNA-binding protein